MAMYKLPKGFDGSFFIGKTVETVYFNENQLYLCFSGKVSLVVEASFSYQPKNGAEERGEVPVKQSSLMALIGSNVTGVQPDDNGTLTLTFSNGDIFQCFDDSDWYESYQIINGDETIIV